MRIFSLVMNCKLGNKLSISVVVNCFGYEHYGAGAAASAVAHAGTSTSCRLRKHAQTAQTCANTAQTVLCLRTICANMRKHAQTCANMRKPSAVGSTSRTDRDLAGPQFPRNCGTKTFILFWGFLGGFPTKRFAKRPRRFFFVGLFEVKDSRSRFEF